VSRSRDSQFQAKQQLVALLKAQVQLLREAPVEEPVLNFDLIRVDRYDRFLAQGPGARWPAGSLPGLKQGIRDLQFMLDRAYTGRQRVQMRQRLRESAGAAAEWRDARDGKQLTAILKRGRIRNEDEYHLVRAEIDRLEAGGIADGRRHRQLCELADAASVG